MADVLSPANKRPTKKHIVKPLTAEQISKGVGVTRKDAALVRKVLLQLGYIKPESSTGAKVSGSKRASATRKAARAKKTVGAKKSSAK